MLEQGLYNAIKNDATISAKIKVGAIYNIYPLVIPEDVQYSMAIAYTEITQRLAYPLARTSIFQINCLADTYDDALGLANDINRIFDDQNEYLLGGVFAVKRTAFYGRTAFKDPDSNKFIYVVEISIKY